MNITTTAIAVTLALVIAVAFLFMGPAVLRPFGNATVTTATTTDAQVANNTMATTSTNGSGAAPAPISGPLPTTLTISDAVVGTGAEAKAGENVTVSYIGMLPDGTVFDASAKHPETAQGFTFPLGAGHVIKGWDLGVAGMKVGGKRQLIIPPDMGYGSQDMGVIPPNSTLIFQVELLKVGA